MLLRLNVAPIDDGLAVGEETDRPQSRSVNAEIRRFSVTSSPEWIPGFPVGQR
jgi:hypothetical protein